ncbi:MAG: hypothetical protein H8D45_06385, partial [Bacteroidetes bacterium]|nr:hypothetical protein [Bacteroidota bacterium]
MKKLHLILITILISLLSQGQTVYIPDASFKAILIELGIDSNNNGEIEYSEAEIVTELPLFSWTEIISDLTGIEAFINLEYLDCGNHAISTLDLSSNTYLKILDCAVNVLDSLNVTQCIQLKKITCYFNQLININISNCINLEELSCHDNSINSIDLSSNLSLNKLICDDNLISNLDLS